MEHVVTLDLQVGRQGRSTVVAVGGEIDLCSAAELRSCLDRVLADGAERIVVDLHDTTFLDCAGLGAIIDVANHLPPTRGGMAVARPSRLVGRVLSILRVDAVLPSFPTVQLAADRLG